MKKLIALLLSLVMLLSLAACGKDDTQKDDDDDKEKTSQTEEKGDKTTEPDDDNKKDPVISDEITVENLMNYPESPEADFVVMDGKEGAKMLYTYLGNDEIVVIPETVNGVAITHIDGGMWANKDPLRAIRLSDSVEYLDRWVFGNNENLEIVVFGSGMKGINSNSAGDAGAFQNCINLKQVVLNDGLETIDGFAFAGCDSLMSIEIPASVTRIGFCAFLSMPEGFTIIGEAGSYAEQYAKENNITFQAK